MRDTVLEHGKGTVKEGFKGVHNLLSLFNRIVDEGHMVANVGDKKLKSWEKVSDVRNQISFAQAMAELEEEAASLKIDINKVKTA